MVLTPRRRRQALRNFSRSDGDKKARSPGRVRNKPLKPIARGMPGVSGVTVVTILVCFLPFAHEAAGASSARHSLRPPFQGDADFQINPGACGAAGTPNCVIRSSAQWKTQDGQRRTDDILAWQRLPTAKAARSQHRATVSWCRRHAAVPRGEPFRGNR
jgi:hypothetical protein